MIVVTGATGNVGRALVASLVGAGHTVTTVARGIGAPLPASRHVTPVTADLSAPETLAPALAGAEALFLLVPGAGAGIDAPALLKAAAAAGAGRVVLLSSQAVGTRPGAVSHAPMAAIEEAVRDAGLEWTILRAGGLASNTLAWAPDIRAERAVSAPYGDVALPLVDPADVAEVAAAALTGGAHVGRTYVLTGPEPVSPRECTEILGTVLGRPLGFAELSAEEARTQMLSFMPAPVADGTLAILGHPTLEETRISPDVAQVIGRAGNSFADWARRNADAFRPAPRP
ncbi:MAG TPA: NAD(P)H-binding protein [Trebonia sp.]